MTTRMKRTIELIVVLGAFVGVAAVFVKEFQFQIWLPFLAFPGFFAVGKLLAFVFKCAVIGCKSFWNLFANLMLRTGWELIEFKAKPFVTPQEGDALIFSCVLWTTISASAFWGKQMFWDVIFWFILSQIPIWAFFKLPKLSR